MEKMEIVSLRHIFTSHKILYEKYKKHFYTHS